MDMKEESKILVAVARLEEKYDKLDDDMKSVISKIDNCMKKSDECAKKNFQYMMSTVLATITAIFGWLLYFEGTR